MATLTMAQTYTYARRAGFDPAAAVIMAAIAAGESGLNPAALGDTTLTNAKWGPSVGLPQIRTLKADTGTGRTRDIARLRDDPLQQMIAAYEISNHGRDFTAWTVYTSGKYRQFVGQAKASAAGGGGYVPGADVQPVGLLDDANQRITGLVVLTVAVALGLGLVVIGAARATGAGQLVGGAVRKAAKVAVLA